MKRPPHEKEWRDRHRTKNALENAVEEIESLVEDLSQNKKYSSFFSENHLAAYCHHFMVDDLPIGWTVMVNPTMSHERKEYKKVARNIPPFFIPDLVIYRKKTKFEEQEDCPIPDEPDNPENEL